MSIDLSSLTPKALQKLIVQATREQKRKKNRAPIARVRNKVTKLATNEGYTIEELFGTGASPATTKTTKRKAAKTGTTGRKVPPKYRNPNNSAETWTGRGRSPLWFSGLIDAGKSREDLLIRD